jgi:hypothetical protein
MKKLFLIGLIFIGLNSYGQASTKNTAIEITDTLTYTVDSNYVAVSVGLGGADSCKVVLLYGSGLTMRTGEIEALKWPAVPDRPFYIRMIPYGGTVEVLGQKR